MAIRYEAQAYQDDNEAMISKAGIRGICRPQKSRTGGIRHNKFLVLIQRGEPVAVWTGSISISAGGVFGHCNVGHVIGDKSVALKFLDYWERLYRPTGLKPPGTGKRKSAQSQLLCFLAAPAWPWLTAIACVSGVTPMATASIGLISIATICGLDRFKLKSDFRGRRGHSL